MKAKSTFLAGMTLAALCLAWSGRTLADNVSNHADPSKHHHYANPDGKLAFSDPSNVIPGHYNFRYYVDQVAKPDPVIWESPGPNALALYPVAETVSTPPQPASAPPSGAVVFPGSSTQWYPVNPGNKVIITSAAPASTATVVQTPTAAQASGQTPAPVNKASKLIGMKVKNQSNEKLGEIKDVVLDPQSGRVDYVVMKKAKAAKGTAKDIAVPLTAFTPAPDRSHLILNADKKQVASASGFSKKNYPPMNNPVYGAQPTTTTTTTTTPTQIQPQVIYIVPVPMSGTHDTDQKQDSDSDQEHSTTPQTMPKTGTDY